MCPVMQCIVVVFRVRQFRKPVVEMVNQKNCATVRYLEPNLHKDTLVLSLTVGVQDIEINTVDNTAEFDCDSPVI